MVAKNRKLPQRRKFYTRNTSRAEVLLTREEVEAEVLLQLRNGKTQLEAIRAGVDLVFHKQADARVARERAERDAQVAARLARNAAAKAKSESPEAAAAWRKREAGWEKRKKETNKRDAARKAELAREREKVPTWNWRTPRRPGWTPPEGVASTGRRKTQSFA